MIIDISQEVFSCNIYPGDPEPEKFVLESMENGEVYNLSAFSMCAHNGTHIDAPYHFIKNGKTIDELELDTLVGVCYVKRHNGEVTAQDAKKILEQAKEQGAKDRILIAGSAVVTAEAAEVFADSKIKLIGNESQSVGPEDAPMAVHLILLQAGVVLLEGLVLTGVEEGKYMLFAAPINLGGFEGAPCRAILIK